MVTRAWIEIVSHGAKAGTLPCAEAVTVVRDAASEAKGADARRYREMAEALAAPPGRTMACVIQGWGGLHLVGADAVIGPGRKLRAVMTALSQATLERKRGGAINASGGDV
jgi:hypothetical protein